MLFDRYIKRTEAGVWKRRLSIILALAVLAMALSTRLILANTVQYPGHADYAFNYTVAGNIVDGRGFQTDYIWQYLSGSETIIHSSNDYWMPLTPLILSLSLFIFGKSLFAALMPSIFAGMALSILVYLFAKTYSDSQFVALVSSALILFMPPLFVFSLLTDTAIFYALFVLASLFFMLKGWENPKFFILSSAFTALAHLTRQDGVFLIPVLMGVILFSRQHVRVKLAYASLTLGLYFLILLPLILSNLQMFGAAFPAGPSKTMFLTQYEDLFSYSKQLSLQSYVEWGLSNIILSKSRMALSNIKTFYDFLGGLSWPLCCGGYFASYDLR